MNFDLDIHNYTKDDLEDLLDLKYPYQSEDINSKCSVFQESVLNNSNLINEKSFDLRKGEALNLYEENIEPIVIRIQIVESIPIYMPPDIFLNL